MAARPPRRTSPSQFHSLASRMHAESQQLFPLSGHRPGQGLPESLHRSHCHPHLHSIVSQSSRATSQRDIRAGQSPAVSLHLFLGQKPHSDTPSRRMAWAGPCTPVLSLLPTLHTPACALGSLNKPRGHSSGLGPAVPPVLPQFCSQPAPLNLPALLRALPMQQCPLPQARGSLSCHPLLPPQHLPQLGLILGAVCWPVGCKFYKGHSLNSPGHHHVPPSGKRVDTWVDGQMVARGVGGGMGELVERWMEGCVCGGRGGLDKWINGWVRRWRG